MKRCTKCQQVKLLADFSPNRRMTDGRHISAQVRAMLQVPPGVPVIVLGAGMTLEVIDGG